jgi:hypothetical protein
VLALSPSGGDDGPHVVGAANALAALKVEGTPEGFRVTHAGGAFLLCRCVDGRYMIQARDPDGQPMHFAGALSLGPVTLSDAVSFCSSLVREPPTLEPSCMDRQAIDRQGNVNALAELVRSAPAGEAPFAMLRDFGGRGGGALGIVQAKPHEPGNADTGGGK